MTSEEDHLFSDIHAAVFSYCEAKGLPLSVHRIAAAMQDTASDEAYAIKLEQHARQAQQDLLELTK